MESKNWRLACGVSFRVEDMVWGYRQQDWKHRNSKRVNDEFRISKPLSKFEPHTAASEYIPIMIRVCTTGSTVTG